MTHTPVLIDPPETYQAIKVMRAEQLLDHIYTALDGAVAMIEATQELDAGVKKRIDEMRTLQVLILKEGDRIDDLNRKLAGAATGRALDLDGARAEIECRLACLRDAGTGGSVP